MKNFNKLWGFRSNKLWKKIVAGSYYVFCILLIISFAFEVPDVKASMYDMVIFKISNILIGFSLLIPFILLSDFKFKEKIPIFNKNKIGYNILGCIIIFLITICSSEVVNIFHTNQYMQRLEAYNTTEIIYKEHNPDKIDETEKSDLTEEELNQNFEDLENKSETNNNETTGNKDNNNSNNNTTDKQENQNTNNNKPVQQPEKEETIIPENKPVVSSKLKVHYIDVGQGDSIFIELPTGETMLIDAGESYKANLVVSYIKNLGYSSIDYIVGTHPHTDHIGGLAQVINQFNIKKIYMPKAVSTSKTYENLLTTIANKGLSVTTAKAGVNIIKQGNLKVDIIAPNSASYSNLNNYSAVIKIIYGSKKFLFMGDAETKSENEILTDVSSDVIKIGHHGSDTSSGESFVNKVNAKYVIIMVGSNNKYDHPYQAIISRWQNKGATIYRTDLNGNIVVTSDGNSININTSR